MSRKVAQVCADVARVPSTMLPPAMTDPNEPSMLAMAALAGDATTVAVTSAFASRGIRCLVLKGRSLADWLYDEDEVRASGDVDLLVAPRDLDAAERQLKTLGFVNKYDGPSPKFAEEHADNWTPAPGSLPVDLHRRLWGIEAPMRTTWARLWEDSETIVVASKEVQVLGLAGRTLLVALHAAHHGPDFIRPMMDLDRAVERLEDAAWDAALELAHALGAAAGLSAGLGLTAGGRDIRDRLALPPADRYAVLRTASLWSEPATAAGFLQFLEASGANERIALLRRELFPSRAFMQSQQGDGALSGTLLARAYVTRWRTLVTNAPAGWRAAQSIRRRSRMRLPS